MKLGDPEVVSGFVCSQQVGGGLGSGGPVDLAIEADGDNAVLASAVDFDFNPEEVLRHGLAAVGSGTVRVTSALRHFEAVFHHTRVVGIRDKSGALVCQIVRCSLIGCAVTIRKPGSPRGS